MTNSQPASLARVNRWGKIYLNRAAWRLVLEHETAPKFLPKTVSLEAVKSRCYVKFWRWRTKQDNSLGHYVYRLVYLYDSWRSTGCPSFTAKGFLKDIGFKTRWTKRRASVTVPVAWDPRRNALEIDLGEYVKHG